MSTNTASIATVTSAQPQRGQFGGTALALVSALSFGVSGPFAKALFTLDWTPTAAILVRIGGGAIILTGLALVTARFPWREWAKAPGFVIAFGLTGLVGGPLCYFNAITYLPVSVAMLIEYTAPILVFAWVWMRSASRPSALTIFGAAVAMIGLLIVVGMSFDAEVNPIGFAWASGAAVCTAAYFILASRSSGTIDSVSLNSGGLIAGTLALLILASTGALPLHASTGTAHVGALAIPWWVAFLVLAIVTSSVAFSTGILAANRLGARVASFLGLTEVLFAITTAWLLLGETPSAVQGVGAIVVIAGLVILNLGERGEHGNRPADTPALPHGHSR